MRYVLDLLYLLALLVLSPWLLWKACTTGKYCRGMLDKFLGRASPHPSPLTTHPSPLVWFHGVSVGEIHLLKQVVAAFRQRHPDWDCVLSVTTDTGREEAVKRFPDLPVIWYPLDFSWAVRRALRTVKPDLIVLAEAELWPNFLFAARAMNIPVAVINGRLSPRTASRYRRLRWLAWPMLRCVDLFAVQTEEYAEHFRGLGVSPEEVRVTGSVKFDGVRLERDKDVESIARLLGIQPGERVWVCGSTQAPEEEIALGIYQKAKEYFPGLRLILVPRQRERFDEVARLLQQRGVPFLRRSELRHPAVPTSPPPVILLDTIGELSAVWGLAEVAFVGGSLDGRRGGQNMIEPAAFGAAVCFGPHVWNFRDIAENLVNCGGAAKVRDAAELEATVRRFLADADERRRSGAAARQFVLAQQGATRLTMDALDALLRQRPLPLAA